MDQKDIKTWINHIYATQDEEYSCDQVLPLLSEYVEQTSDSQPLGSIAALVSHHLHQCPDCQEVYEGLRYLLEVEANGELDDIEEDSEFTVAPQPHPGNLSPVPGGS